jgi:hypothetical protein
MHAEKAKEQRLDVWAGWLYLLSNMNKNLLTSPNHLSLSQYIPHTKGKRLLVSLGRLRPSAPVNWKSPWMRLFQFFLAVVSSKTTGKPRRLCLSFIFPGEADSRESYDSRGPREAVVGPRQQQGGEEGRGERRGSSRPGTGGEAGLGEEKCWWEGGSNGSSRGVHRRLVLRSSWSSPSPHTSSLLSSRTSSLLSPRDPRRCGPPQAVDGAEGAPHEAMAVAPARALMDPPTKRPPRRPLLLPRGRSLEAAVAADAPLVAPRGGLHSPSTAAGSIDTGEPPCHPFLPRAE